MPTRMIRDNLLNSDRFLGLPDNTARICYVASLLTADDRGNHEAGLGHLVRMWRDFGVDSTEKAAAISQFLADQDLLRFYEIDGKKYLHVPRFGQRMRSFKRACPPSPWCGKDLEESKNSSPNCQQVAASSRKSRPEVKRREVNPLAQTSFARFWERYPKRVSRGHAEKAWQKLSPDEQLIAQIFQAIERAMTTDKWRKESGRFIPHASTWLNAKGWLDESSPIAERRVVV